MMKVWGMPFSSVVQPYNNATQMFSQQSLARRSPANASQPRNAVRHTLPLGLPLSELPQKSKFHARLSFIAHAYLKEVLHNSRHACQPNFCHSACPIPHASHLWPAVLSFCKILANYSLRKNDITSCSTDLGMPKSHAAFIRHAYQTEELPF